MRGTACCSVRTASASPGGPTRSSTTSSASGASPCRAIRADRSRAHSTAPVPQRRTEMMMTGEEYRESLRDGRKVFCQGERIDDVTTHPLTRLAVDWIVRGYDEHYDPTAECGPYFTIPRSVEELRHTEELQKEWDFPTISTSSGLLMLLNASSRMVGLENYADRVLGFFEDAKTRDVRAVLTITDAKGARANPPKQQDDPHFYVRIVDRTSDGIVTSGAKMHISSAVAAHELIVMPTKRMKQD